MLLATSAEKKACPFQSKVAGQLFGFVKATNRKLKTMVPNAKKSTAAPDTLFKCPGKCDQRQFSTGIELMARQEIGTTKQHSPSTKRFNFMFMTKGRVAKTKPHPLITTLYPNTLDNRVAISIINAEGTIAQSKIIEFVNEVMVVPLFLRYEKKYMLVAPHIPKIPAANLIKLVPTRVRIADSSASLNILIIAFITHRNNVTTQTDRSLIEQMEIAILSFVERSALALFVNVGQKGSFWMPSKNFLGATAFDFMGLSSILNIENIYVACLTARCHISAVAAKRYSAISSVRFVVEDSFAYNIRNVMDLQQRIL